jgi:hypothetical protein
MRLPGLYEGRRGSASAQLDSVFLNQYGDADTFACWMQGGASANEVGVGMGLTGANATLTQYGGMPGAVNGWRGCNISHGFVAPFPMLIASLGADTQWTLAYRIRKVDFSTRPANAKLMAFTAMQCYAAGPPYKDSGLQMYFAATDGSPTHQNYLWADSCDDALWPGQQSTVSFYGPRAKTMAQWMEFDGWVVMSRFGGMYCFGTSINSVMPTNYYDLDPLHRWRSFDGNNGRALMNFSANSWYSGQWNAVFGATASASWNVYGPKCDIGAILMSKKGLPMPQMVW